MERCALRIGIVLIGMGAVLWFGCTGLECDESTQEYDGRCVAVELDCPQGAVEDDGVCVPKEPVDCGEGTERDPTDNRCYATEESCGEGTMFSSDAQGCVPTDEICDEGTVFDSDRRRCTAEQSCGSGEVLDDGECMTETEAMAEDADAVADGTTDPEFGGDPVDVDVGDIGDPAVVSGVIDAPEDLNDDGHPDQYRDHFRFEAAAGDWIEIEFFSLGLPGSEFVVFKEDDGGVEYQRRSRSGSTDDKARQFVIPEDGHYLLVVEPGGVAEQPVGSDDWRYVGSLESMETPTPTDFEFATQDLEHQIGELDGNYFYSQDYEAGESLELTWEELPQDTEPVLQAWASSTDYIGEFDGTTADIEIPSSGQLQLVVDWRTAPVFSSGDYRISGQYSGVLSPGEQRDTEIQVDERDGLEVGWTSSQTATEEVEVTVENEAGHRVYDGEMIEAQSIGLPNLEAGTYEITYHNSTNTVLDDFQSEATIVEPTEKATVDPSSGDMVHIEQDNNDFHTVDIIAVHDNSQHVVASKHQMDRSTGLIADFLAFRAMESGQHTVYIYEYQSLQNSTITVDAQIVDTAGLGSFSVDGADAHGVVEVSHDYDELLPLVVEAQDNPTESVIATIADDEHLSVVGVEPGAYNVRYLGDDGPTTDDVNIETEVVDPIDIVDISDTHFGSANDDYVGSHDFYYLEVDDTTQYDIELEHTGGGTGLGRIFVYEMAHQLVRRNSQSSTINSPSSTAKTSFEADTPYIIRVGNDRIGAGHDFDYELSFDEVN